MQSFFELIAEQRWDDHRFYHQSRINQSLHLISAIAFLVAYGLLFVDPAWAAIVAWCISMTTRQAGHFFFEPRGFDTVNGVSDEFKEEIKVGYNIRRKVVLMGAWLGIPVVLALAPSLGGLIEPAADGWAYVHDVGMAWLALGVAGLLVRVAQLWWLQSLKVGLAWAAKLLTDPFHDIALYHRAPLHLLVRVAQLWWLQNLMVGLAWAAKLLTDPFHDIALYHRAPLHLLRGELLDPMHHVHKR